MATTSEQIKPQARSEGLVIQELSDEVLVYDLERDKAHCLNQTAAIVWKNCDGKTTISEIARILSKESGLPANEGIVWLALDQLGKARLLPDKVMNAKANSVMTRRDVMKRIGIRVAIALPVVTSILAPQVQAGISCTCINLTDCGPFPNCPQGACTAGQCSPPGLTRDDK